VPQHDAADRLSRLLEARIEGEVGCAPGARPEDSGEDEDEDGNPPICREIPMPEEGFEPPTRGL
jgi:hypothetical protein